MLSFFTIILLWGIRLSPYSLQENQMNPDEINLSNLSKSFEYTKLAREIDTCNDKEELKNIAKCYVKLYLRIQETVASMGSM